MEERFQKIEQLLSRIEHLLNKGDKRYEKEILNLQEASAYLNISGSTIYKRTSQGNIPHYKPNGKLILFKKEDLDEWIEARRISSKKELQAAGLKKGKEVSCQG
jgi:excisionase family DNA binding protein